MPSFRGLSSLNTVTAHPEPVRHIRETGCAFNAAQLCVLHAWDASTYLPPNNADTPQFMITAASRTAAHYNARYLSATHLPVLRTAVHHTPGRQPDSSWASAAVSLGAPNRSGLRRMVTILSAKRKANTIGTHSGTFHCDEALGCFLLHQVRWGAWQGVHAAGCSWPTEQSAPIGSVVQLHAPVLPC